MNAPTPFPSRLALLTGAALLTAATLTAQTAPAAPPARPAEETVQLSTFTVSAEDDQGYYAPSAISGTRLATLSIVAPTGRPRAAGAATVPGASAPCLSLARR